MKEYTVDLPDGAKEYVLEFKNGEDKTSRLNESLSALNFVRETEEFTTAEIQRYLKCGYSTVTKVLDALCLLYFIEVVEGTQSSGGCRYKRL